MVSRNKYPGEMRDALKQFGCEAEQIVGAFAETVALQKPRRRIYHYTNDAGLRGILESGNLWFTDICSLNDPSELNHGFNVAFRELSRAAAGGPRESQEFSRILRSETEARGVQSAVLCFACCFSSHRDDLGQWRAYADNGRGFALEFDAAALKDGFDRTRSTAVNTEECAVSFPVTYSDRKLAALDRQIIEGMLGLISLPRGRGLNSTEIISFTEDLALALMSQAAYAALFFKHRAYKSEREYRFLETFSVDAPPEVKRRARRNSLIRYREFDWRKAVPGALKGIIVGPADQKKAFQFAGECLRWFPNSGNVRIDCSSIPYRT